MKVVGWWLDNSHLFDVFLKAPLYLVLESSKQWRMQDLLFNSSSLLFFAFSISNFLFTTEGLNIFL